MDAKDFVAKDSFPNVHQDVLFDHYGAAARGSGIFGLSCTPEESRIVLLPVPWEATVSYGEGTAKAPEAIRRASTQVDLFDRELGLFYKAGIAMLPESEEVKKWNTEARENALRVLEEGGVTDGNRKNAERVNALGEQLNVYIEEETRRILAAGKIPGLVGGDHSTPLGAIKACAEKEVEIGVLHIDAHFDARENFEDFRYSHGSIMFNVMDKVPGVQKLVQVGIRDFCREENEFVSRNAGKITVFFDEDMAGRTLSGTPWAKICAEIVETLPQQVYISFDIDGLDPSLCPHTGTPVPGGLTFNQAHFLIKTLVKAGHRIVGFDLVEVAPGPSGDGSTLRQGSGQASLTTGEGEWDANVGARLLFKLCGWALRSQA